MIIAKVVKPMSATPTPKPVDAKLALARRIVAETYVHPTAKAAILDGDNAFADEVQIALAAIDATTELAVDLARRECCRGCRTEADLRNGEHLTQGEG